MIDTTTLKQMQQTDVTHAAVYSAADVIWKILNGTAIDGSTNIIDISWWQDPALIDYDTLVKQIDGAIIRGAYGAFADARFNTHAKNLSERGVNLGAYHYILGNVNYMDQLTAFKKATADFDLPLGYWTDVEDIRPETMLSRTLVDNYIKAADDLFGEQQGVYTSISRWDAIMGVSYHSFRKLWVAHYTSAARPLLPKTGGWDHEWLWQKTNNAKFNGYSGSVDNSVFYGTEAQWYAALGIDISTPDTDPEQLLDIIKRICEINAFTQEQIEKLRAVVVEINTAINEVDINSITALRAAIDELQKLVN